MWGGRFGGGSDALFTAFNDSLAVDARLVHDDVAGSIAWSEALRGAGVLTADEAAAIETALRRIDEEAARDPAAVQSAAAEDVHTWVEVQLIDRLGDLGKKLHTGRSRNDQVATDLRVWMRREIDARRDEIGRLQSALVRLAEREEATVMPGYTHLQRAQPVLFAHWCLAYFEMLDRDTARCADAAARAGSCPLGAGALAGTAYAIDRDALARSLGFSRAARNSLDAVGDRDFVLEALSAIAICGVHLSRLAEDLVFFASAEAGFVELDDSMTSGSSIMPQKKNPDALELVRGKSGRLLGHFVSVAVTLKGLPLAYDKDLQEDKAPLFDAMDTLSLCLRVIPPLLDRLVVHRDRTRRAAEGGYANATDLADYLAGKGMPFRDAHEVAGRLVRVAMERGVPLEGLALADLKAAAPLAEADVFEHLSLEAGLARRDVPGGTAPSRVRAAIIEARERCRGRD